MKKEELLDQVTTLASQHLITRRDVLGAYDRGRKERGQAATQVNISKVLYHIGGIIVLLGIAVLVWQNWTSLSPLTRILATLGSGIAAYIVAAFLSRDQQFYELAQAFHIISAFLLPVGLFVTFDAAGINVRTSGIQSVTSGILLITYVLTYWVFKRDIFALFSVLFGTWFYYSVATYVAQDYQGRLRPDQFYEYLTLAAGAFHGFLGYFFATNKKPELAGWLYGIGVLASLGAALALGGWAPNQNLFWEIIFPGIAFGAIFLSVYVKSRAMLVVSALFIMGYILKLTSEYFSQSLGWPLALVIVGFILIGLGYGAVWLNKKYLS